MPHRPLMIGVAGGTGSGKTTVARRVAAALADSSVAFVEMDSYYRNHVGLTMQELHRVNWDHPDAFDVDLFVAHLDLLFTDERLRQRLDVKVFVDADADIRLVRRVKRDMASRGRPLEEILEQYVNTVRPMHLQFVEPSKRWADVIVPRGGHNTVAIEMILAKIRQRLATNGAPHIPMVPEERRKHSADALPHPATREHTA